jgi:hypothetical protein
MVWEHSSTAGLLYNGDRSGHFLADLINEVESIINQLELKLATTRVVLLQGTQSMQMNGLSARWK